MWSISNDLCWFKFTLNNRWQLQSIYIYSTIKNWNSYTIRICIHSWGMWLAQYQFTNSWISLNLATISIYRENKIYWWRAVGRIENLGSFFLSLVEMMAIFRVMRVKHTVASFYISRARFMCMRTQRKYVNKNTSWISSQCFNSAIDFLILDIYIVVCLCVCVRFIWNFRGMECENVFGDIQVIFSPSPMMAHTI